MTGDRDGAPETDGPPSDGDGDRSDATNEEATGDSQYSLLGVELVVEESFRTFPWGAGLRRAVVAFATSFVLVAGLVLYGGTADGSLVDRVTTIGFVTFHAHNVPMTFSTSIPEMDGVSRAFRGAFVVGHDHGSPLGHSLDVLDGKTDRIGHFDTLKDSGDPDLPTALYYLVPVSVLVGVGFEYADSYWDATATESPLEVVRFGVAVGAGYALVLALATIPFTIVSFSRIWGAVIFVPDRYLAVAFGFAYPVVFSSVGAALVYVRREGIGGSQTEDAGGVIADDGVANDVVAGDAVADDAAADDALVDE